MNMMHALKFFLEIVGGVAITSMGFTWASLYFLGKKVNQKRVDRESHGHHSAVA